MSDFTEAEVNARWEQWKNKWANKRSNDNNVRLANLHAQKEPQLLKIVVSDFKLRMIRQEIAAERAKNATSIVLFLIIGEVIK